MKKESTTVDLISGDFLFIYLADIPDVKERATHDCFQCDESEIGNQQARAVYLFAIGGL